jgi:hypothetical protein
MYAGALVLLNMMLCIVSLVCADINNNKSPLFLLGA